MISDKRNTINSFFDLTGKVAFVTGAHAWLGWDMASILAEAGCDIVVTSRDEKRAVETASKLHDEYGVDTLGVKLDQKNYDEVVLAAQKALAWKGHIDILINNAGGGSGASEGNLFKRSAEDINNLITTNLIGALYCCKEIGRIMADNGGGKIINIGSIAGIVGRDREMYRRNNKGEQPIDYAASKAGVIGMTRDLAAFMAPYHVNVNCISPGGFDKGDIPEGFVNDYAALTPQRKMGTMGKDLKGTALFLASGASDYITGQNIVVDGGFSSCK